MSSTNWRFRATVKSLTFTCKDKETYSASVKFDYQDLLVFNQEKVGIAWEYNASDKLNNLKALEENASFTFQQENACNLFSFLSAHSRENLLIEFESTAGKNIIVGVTLDYG